MEYKDFYHRGVYFKIAEMGQEVLLIYPKEIESDPNTFTPNEEELSEFLGYKVICVDFGKSFTKYIKAS